MVTVDYLSPEVEVLTTRLLFGPALDTTTVPSSEPAPTTMHVADLDGSGVTLDSKGNWEATVTAIVLDADNGPVEGATVSGTWGSCTTDGSGQCSSSSGRLKKNVSSTTFTVDDVTHATYAYNPNGNTDPDGDSDGTTIVISKP
jgi:hypothetical protein